MQTWFAAEAVQQEGFRWVNLLVLVLVALVAWPLYTALRSSISRRRRERWAREEGWAERPSEDSDRPAE